MSYESWLEVSNSSSELIPRAKAERVAFHPLAEAQRLSSSRFVSVGSIGPIALDRISRN
jgi:hypothetical protein